jgi:hypothetical protein
MAVYKVPQDVEADDKLLGPFSFRQFVYLIIVFLSGLAAWGLGRLFIPLAVLPLPIIVFFGALALPLRKDQPMEIYMAAMVSFYLKPRRRLWKPDGITSLVEVVAPKEVEQQRTKDFSQSEAERRLSYLANIVDSQGWAVRGVGGMPAVPNSPMNSDVYYEAQQTEDILDDDTTLSQNFDHMIAANDTRHRQEVIDRMRQPAPPIEPTAASIQPVAPPNPYDVFLNSVPASDPQPTVADTPAVAAPEPTLQFNPYPTDIRQSVLQPLSAQPAPSPQAATPQAPPAPTTTSEKVVSPDIINLANQHDLSIETIAREANRITQREQQLSEQEVVISLR